MNDTPTNDASLGLVARVVGVILSPSATFRSVAADPRPAGVLFVVCLAIGLATGAPQLTERGRQAALASQVEQIERFTGQSVTTEQYIQMERRASVGAYIAIVGMFVFIPFVTVVFSALYWAFFNIVLNGSATFRQVVAVTAHAAVIGALGTVIGAPIQLMQGTFSQAGPFNFGALAPMLDPASGLMLFLSTVTFFGIWQVIVGGIGLAVLYNRRPTGIIVGLLLIYLGTTAIFTVGLASVIGGT